MKRIIALAFALAAFVAASEDNGIYYIPSVQGERGAVPFTFNQKVYWFKPIDLSGTISMQSDVSWWFTPDSSTVDGVTVTIKKLSKPNEDYANPIVVTPKMTEEDILTKIKNARIPGSAEGAYNIAAAALAKSIYNEIQTKFIKENIETLAKSVQSAYLVSTEACSQNYTTDDGIPIRVVDNTNLDRIQSLSTDFSQIRGLRTRFTTEQGAGNVQIPKGSVIVQGSVAIGGGGDSSPTDAMSVTNLKYTAIENNKEVEKSVTTLAGWWYDYGADGGLRRDKVDSAFLSEFTLEDLMKETDDESRKKLNKQYLLMRTGDGRMNYMKMDSQLKAAVIADDWSITTNIHWGAVESGTLSLAGWTWGAASETLSEALLRDPSTVNPQQRYIDAVLVREITPGEYSMTNLVYYNFGDLYKISWSTNWNDAAKDIAAKEAEKVVNWNTNWVRLADNIASSQSKMKEYVDNSLNWSTNFFASTKDLNGSQAKIKDYIDGQVGMMTNMLSAVQSAIAATEGNISGTRDYIDRLMDFQSNVVISAELAKMNGSIEGVKQYVDDVFDWTTNFVLGIEQGRENGTIESMHTYVQDTFDWTTNLVFAIEAGRENGTIKSMKEFTEYSFALITNRLAAIERIIEDSQLPNVSDIPSYINTALDVETNVVINLKLAEMNKSIDSVKDYIDKNFDYFTNLVNTLNEAIKDQKTKIASIGEYAKADSEKAITEIDAIQEAVDKLGLDDVETISDFIEYQYDYETNLYAMIQSAKDNSSVQGVRDYVRATTDLMTNEISAIRGVIGDIDGVNSISDYLREYYAIQTNLIKKVKKIEGYKPEVFVNNITNFYTTVLNEITNWNIITNVFITYLDGKGDAGGGGGGGGGGVDAPLELPPTKDPYKEDFVKEEKTFDYFLPVKNGWMISQMTNDLWGIVNAEHALDNMSLYTNEARRAEIQGYEEAETNKMPVKVKLEQPKKDRDGNPILYGIEWMDYPSALVAITSEGIDKIVKWLKVMQTDNIFTLVASNTERVAMLQTSPYNVINANALLDNASIWTNDNFLAEVKGFQYAPYYSYPVKVMGSNNDEVEWTPIDQPDSVVAFDYGDGERLVYNRSLSRAIDYGVSSISNVWSLYGFNESVAGTAPRIGYDELGNKELEWKAEAKPDSEVPLDYAPYNTTFSSIERTDDYGVGSASNVWSVYGFRYAAEGTAPHVHTDEYGNRTLSWKPTTSAIRFVGNVGSNGTLNEAVVGYGAKTNTVTFASAADSNVKVDVQGDGNGNVTITIGVYYVTESNLNPSSGSSGL